MKDICIVIGLLLALVSCAPAPAPTCCNLCKTDTGKADGKIADARKADTMKQDTIKADMRMDLAKADAPSSLNKTYYVRVAGGTSIQCNGLANLDYSGTGVNQACAFSHPFFVLPPGGTPLIKGGETLIIGKGSYAIGYGAPGATTCNSSWTWDCVMPAIPSGPNVLTPTRILGEGWNTGCATAPSLYGVERPWRILNLRNSSNIEVRCLEITDHQNCVESHSGGLACIRDTFPHGQWAPIGLEAADSSNVLLKNLNIHGLANKGVWAGRLTNWTMEDVRIAGNGWVGWDGDLAEPQGSSNSGKIIMRRVNIEWNGCSETYPGGLPVGCWGQTAGGYGDGLGTAATGGDWIIEDSNFSHNTSDGIDLLYHSLGGTITITRTRAEGNAGNQIKVAGNATITNTIAVGNCAFFQGKAFTYNVDNCRALGNTVVFAYTAGSKASMVSSSVYGQGDTLILAIERTACAGGETLTLLGNLFYGDTEYLSPTEKAGLYYRDSCSTLVLTQDYNLVYNVQNQASCPFGVHDVCSNPLIGPLTGNTYNMVPSLTSPVIDKGPPSGGLVPTSDFLGVQRPQGVGNDIGAYEVK